MVEKIILDEKVSSPIIYGILGDTYVYANEREIEVEQPVNNESSGDTVSNETELVTKYEYDVRHFPLTDKTEAGVITALKAQIIDELMAFDSGQYAQYGDEAVNDFTVNGIHMWLDKETRNGLRLRFDSQQSLGQTQTTLWYGIMPLQLQITNAIQMLQYLEVYASACFDRTASHRQSITALADIDEIFNYDYKSGYPEHPVF